MIFTLFGSYIAPDVYCRFVDIGTDRWIPVVDVMAAASQIGAKTGTPRLERPQPAAVSMVLGKPVDEMFKKFEDLGIDDAWINKKASLINQIALITFLRLAGLSGQVADEVAVNLMGATPPPPPAPPRDMTPAEIRETFIALSDTYAKRYNELTDAVNVLKQTVRDLRQRVFELEQADSEDDAADAILAEANRLYAKGKAMKAGRR